MYVLLSYPLAKGDPVWPGNPEIAFDKITSIPDGDDANTYLVHVYDHIGTHMDGPNHFYNEGKQLWELPLETFIYEKPLLIEVPLDDLQVIRPEDLMPFADQIKEADLLMVRSGLAHKRVDAPEDYAERGPCFGGDSAKYLMDNFRLKAVAMDWISLGTPSMPAEAKVAHRYMLGAHHDHATCIIEDANFEPLVGKKIKKVFGIPIFIPGIDSSNITMFAEVE